jgi:L-threonylcarbamoyladenylate synthase
MTAVHERSGVDLERAVDVLRSGGLIGLPTETVYGLAARADDPNAVAKVFAVKGRPRGHPLIVHFSSLETARTASSHWTNVAEALGSRFWPGPLTLVVRRAAWVIDEVTGGLDTVAIRVPAHPVARDVIDRLGVGVVAPSANPFGMVSPTRAEHVLKDLGDGVDYVLDGGPCDIGVESTIVDCSTEVPQILRPGVVTEADVVETVGSIAPTSGPSRAPGMLASHYAPRCSVRAVETDDEAQPFRDRGILVVDARSDPASFVRDLYSTLRRCDDEGRDEIVVVLPDDDGIGRAVRDRIMKAAAPRP